MNEYCTYGELQDYAFTENDSLTTAETENLRLFCTTASRMIDGYTHRFFYPYIDTLEFDYPEDDDTRLLVKPHDLLAVSTFTTQNGDTTVTAAQYYLMCGNSYNHTPYDRIVLKTDSTRPNLLYSGTMQQANAVTGTWGYHEDWANAWQDSNDTLQAAISSTTATTFTVADADGNDVYGIGPRFRVQHLLKIDSEYLYCTAINTTTNTLTVRRGVNGSTAATHDNASTVYVYVPMEEIHIACKVLAKWLYDMRQSGPEDQAAFVDASGTTRLPPNAPLVTQIAVERYKRRL